jgi:hypothetical protein
MSRHSSESIIKSTPQQGGIKNYKSETNTNSREKREEGFKLIKKVTLEKMFSKAAVWKENTWGALCRRLRPPRWIFTELPGSWE